MTTTRGHIEDAALVAMIDGEADAGECRRLALLMAGDPAVAARFDMLSRSSQDFAGAFQPLLDEAPLARLQAGLDAVSRPAARSAPAHVQTTGTRLNRRHMLAAGIALFVSGSLAPHYIGELLPRAAPVDEDDHADDWRAAVAAYLDLYTADTLANLPDDDVALNRQLADVGGTLGLPLSTSSVRLAGVRMKRAQTFRYDDEPLAQIAYLDADAAPMALCIIARPGVSDGINSEVRHALNVAYWGSRSHQFMLIGRRPMTEIEGMATGLVAQLAV